MSNAFAFGGLNAVLVARRMSAMTTIPFTSIASARRSRRTTCMLPFMTFARSLLSRGAAIATLFDRMAERSGIVHRFSVLATRRREPGAEQVDAEGVSVRRGAVPATAGARMRHYEHGIR